MSSAVRLGRLREDGSIEVFTSIPVGASGLVTIDRGELVPMSRWAVIKTNTGEKRVDLWQYTPQARAERRRVRMARKKRRGWA